MGLVEGLMVCTALFLLFPKGFKFLVGSYLGAVCGIMCWWLAIVASYAFLTRGWFVSFTIAGIVAGWAFAACG